METLTDRVELSRQNGPLVTENETWIREIVMAVRGKLNQWPVIRARCHGHHCHSISSFELEVVQLCSYGRIWGSCSISFNSMRQCATSEDLHYIVTLLCSAL